MEHPYLFFVKLFEAIGLGITIPMSFTPGW